MVELSPNKNPHAESTVACSDWAKSYSSLAFLLVTLGLSLLHVAINSQNPL